MSPAEVLFTFLAIAAGVFVTIQVASILDALLADWLRRRRGGKGGGPC